VTLEQVGQFADVVAVARAGELTRRLCRELHYGIITVDTDAMCAAIQDISEDTRVLTEPARA